MRKPGFFRLIKFYLSAVDERPADFGGIIVAARPIAVATDGYQKIAVAARGTIAVKPQTDFYGKATLR